MSDLITLYVPPSELTTCLEQVEVAGKKLYKQNENYRILANCFEHPEFRKFFDTYFSDENDIKFVLMIVNLYKEIEKSSPVELNGYQKLSILDSVLKDQDFRRKLCEYSNKGMKIMDTNCIMLNT